MTINFNSLTVPPEGYFIASHQTYEEVYRIAEHLGAVLADGNDGKPVCVCSEEKTILLASLIASIFSGIPVVIPYSFSPQILREARDVTGFSRVIADEGRDIIDGVLVINPHIEGKIHRRFSRVIYPDRIFVYLFTGGSTGTPKVWSKTVRNIFSEGINLVQTFGISGSDVIMATVPPYHIYGLLFSVIVPLVSGAAVLPDTYTFPQEICATMKSGTPTVFVSVPMHYRIMRGYDAHGHRIRIAFSSAGMLARDDADAFFAFTGIGVHEVYGSTETGGIAWRCRASGDLFFRPFNVASCSVIGDRLAVKSDFISPELPRDVNGFFLTGDRVVEKDNGLFELLGRSDGVVKVAGKRVDIGDVQNKLKRISGITDVYVFSLPGRSGRQSEIGALIEGNIDEATVRREAMTFLEPYAVPRRIKIVDKLPTLSTGKYNKKAIEELFSCISK